MTDQLPILIVEDSMTQRMLLESNLKDSGFQVIPTANGIEALAQLKQQLPFMVISDIQMPEMDGYTLCKKIKEDANLSSVPVMLLTSLSEPIDVIRGIESGADSFLCKPYSKQLLCFHIAHILENRKLRQTDPNSSHIYFNGELHTLPIHPVQITDLLLSVYMSAMEKHKELVEANEKLNLLNNQKNYFLGMAAHDLRNPLGVIRGYSKLLMESLEGKIEKESINILSRINRASISMLNLIDDLLNVSAIESGHVDLNLAPQDLAVLSQDNILLIQELAKNKQITVQFSSSPNLPKVMVDKHRFEQIFTNLLTNAIKFSNPGTTIEITLAQKDSEVIFSVKDQGPGIAPTEKDKLFGSFQKLSTKATAGESSTGLGLSIVKKLVVEHKGRIWVESELGKGSTFFVALPSIKN